jgi:hypothetical protein
LVLVSINHDHSSAVVLLLFQEKIYLWSA